MQFGSRTLARFIKNESGVSAIEYAMIAATTALVLAVVMPTVKSSLSTSYTSVSDNLQ